jgi:predicted membrane channel-forming protein YqfA (hemolysin III family)
MMPRLAQWPEYHQMADTRALLGIPNALNVLSNIPFAAVGILGFASVFAASHGRPNRPAYSTFFAGVTLTAAGSTFYHLAPDNFRLVWDRLPMTIAFMALLAAVAAERVDARVSRLLFPLVVAGGASVLYWYWSEARGAGDLRLYAFVQFGSLVVIALTLLLYRGGGTPYLVAGLLAYGLSKVCETYDAQVFAGLHVVSGHTLKHLLAAAGAACVIPLIRIDLTSRVTANGAPRRARRPLLSPSLLAEHPVGLFAGRTRDDRSGDGGSGLR